MTPVVDVQFTSGYADWSHLRDSALAAEESGYGAVWIVDHLAGRSMGGEQSFEAFTWLGALAASTSRIELGALVVNAWNREVGVSAVGAATVSAISGRQFWFGIGAGTSPSSSFAWEQKMVGARIEPSLERRHDRVVELLELCDRMWSEGDVSLPTFIRPQHTPRRIVGVNSVRLAEIAGRLADGINVAWRHPRRDEFLSACRVAARDRDFTWTTYLPWSDGIEDAEHPERAAMAAAGIDRVIILHPENPPASLRVV
ncbi:MAG: LLM class flavin-dependent oxidoreductase [Actinomycetota bacterium]|nr:LLM class flavin-dependent oxidoreductase [Actinomycetota bacterium]MDA3014119.1 LLM class flavin-dependent oxidoreductase [Actinomycetota bacterium]MDA3028757.1 LLM class flavin-dependent oxidoreductase [Actinomycetota bacterium]